MHLPKAKITFDKFHVFKLLSDAIDQVRRQEMKKDKTLKGSRFSLLKNPENLTSKQRLLLAKVQQRNANLAEAYRLKETFRDVYRQRSKDDARGLMNAWVTSAYASGIAALHTAANTTRKHWDEILHWYDTHITNAIMDGTQQPDPSGQAKSQRLPHPKEPPHHRLPRGGQTRPQTLSLTEINSLASTRSRELLRLQSLK